jgi:uroporphyrin-3 C-methyltransferase
MSDAQTTESTPSEPGVTQRPRRTNRAKRWAVIILGVGVVALLAQQAWTWRLWEGLQREEVALPGMASVDDRLAALESAVGSQQQMQTEMALLRQAFMRDRLLLQVDRLEEQMDAGWQIWLLTGQSKTLGTALENGQRWLTQVPMPEAQALKLALTRDLTELRGRQVVDLRDTVQQLDGLIASVDKLPLLQDRRLPPPDPGQASAKAGHAAQGAVQTGASEPASPETLMERARLLVADVTASIWQSIRQMVRVQRLDRAEPGLIAPEQKVFLQQGLRLLLLDARHALVQRNTAVYQQSLDQARAWITKYCDTANALVASDLELLQGLRAVNPDPATVSLEATRLALTAYRAALLGGEASTSSQLSPDAANTDATEPAPANVSQPPADAAAKGSAT